jgi:hypothetical protein
LAKRKKAVRGLPRAQKINLRNLPDEEFVSSEIAARVLGLAPVTLQTWRCRKCGPAFYKIGRLAYYRGADLVAWLAKQRQEPATT